MLKTSLPTTEMQVTSIRFERELIDHLKTLSGGQGYQSLVRNILWEYVRQHNSQPCSEYRSAQGNGQRPQIQPQQIRATFPAQAQCREYCVLTGQLIPPQEAMWLGMTATNEFVPLSQAGLAQLQAEQN